MQLPDPDAEARLAHQSLAAGDYARALIHIAQGLAGRPDDPALLVLSEHAFAAAGDPVTLLDPRGSELDFATAALQARALARAGEHLQALALLSEVVGAHPDIAYLEWAIPWLHQPGVLDQIGLDFAAARLLARYVRMLHSAPSPMEAGDPRKPNAEAAEHICRVLERRFPDHGIVYFAGAAIARRLGYFDEAVEMASHGYRVDPSWQTCIGLASAYRDAGELERAAAAFEQALRLQPDDESPLLDLGDMFLEAEEHERALGYYERVLERAPEHEWALPSALYLRAHLGRDPAARGRLLAMRGASARAELLASALDPPRPWVNVIPEPGDASARQIGQLLQTIAARPDAVGGQPSIDLATPEAPSAVLAFWIGTRALGRPNDVHLSIRAIPQPDPRLPKTEVDFQLWRWEGNRPQIAIGSPDPLAAEAIAQIAREPYDIGRWEEVARDTGRRFGPGWARNFAAVMVQPPPPPPATDPCMWVRRVQLACALVIAGTEADWDGTERRQVLFTIALGPSDWATEAAIVAMARVATQQRAARHDVLELFAWLEGQIPDAGHCCYQLTLAQAWRLIPDLDAATASRLDTIV